MSGPWEQFASAEPAAPAPESGPWAAYSEPAVAPRSVTAPDRVPQAFEDRLEAGDLARKREGGLLQTIPQGIELMSTPEGRTRIWEAVKKYPSKFIDDTINIAKLPGDVQAGKIDLNTEEGMDQAIGLGMLVAGSRLNKLGQTGKTSGLSVAMGETVSRIDRGPMGEIVELPIGTMARSEDFVTASQIVAGEKAPMAVQEKMLKAYEEKGLHPAELAHDAQTDPIVAQRLLSSDKADLPPGGPPPRPPEPPATPKTPPEPPAPPPEGSFEAAQQKILDKISVGESAPKERMTWDKFYTQAVDDLHPIKGVSEDAYVTARLSRGQFGKAQQFLEHGTFDFDTYATNGKPLYEIIKPVAGDIEPFRAYIASKRALEIEASGRKSGMDVEAAQRVVAEGDAKFGKMAEELTEYQNQLLTYLKKSGVLTDEAHAAMLEAGKNYVPFYRVFGEESGGSVGKSFGPGNPLKKLKGSERDIVDPLESIIKNTYAYISVAERNAVGIKIIDALKADGAEVKVSPSKAPKKPRLTDDQLRAEVQKWTEGADGKADLNAIPEAVERLGKPLSSEQTFYRGEWADRPQFGSEKGSISVSDRKAGESFAISRNDVALEAGPNGRIPLSEIKVPAGTKVLDAASLAGKNAKELERILPPGKFVLEGVRTEPSRLGTPFEIKTYRFEPEAPKLNAKGADADLLNYLHENGVTNPEAIVDFLKTTAQQDGDVIGAFRNGVKEQVKVNDPDLVTAFRGLDQEGAGLIMRIIATPAKVLRSGAVLSPDFIVRNVVRDFMTAFINSKGVFSPIDTFKGLKSAIRKDVDFQDWLKGGGSNSTLVALDRRYLQESLQKLDQETGLMSRAWNVVTNPLAPLRMISELAEQATRLGEFKKVRGADKASIDAAAFASREVTLDFARIGASMRAYNMITAFGNAQIQGLDRVGRAFIDRPTNTMLKVAGGITLPSVLLWFANKDDERVKELPSWQKDMFWIVATKDHLYRIPKPFELGVVFGSGVERVLDATIGNNPDAFNKFSESVIDIILPSMTPTALQPIVEQWANKSTFTDRTLIPADQEKNLPEYQYTPYTTELTKALGKIVTAFPGMSAMANGPGAPFGPIGKFVAQGVSSPILVENYVRSWTGGLGNYALQAADFGLRKAGALPDPVKPTDTLADIPVVKAFVVRYPSANAQSIQDFYDQNETSKKFYDTWSAKAKEGDTEAMERIQQAGGPMMFLRLDAIKETLGEHSKLVRDIYKNPSIKAEEKRQLIDTLYFNMIEIGKGGKQMIRDSKAALAQP